MRIKTLGRIRKAIIPVAGLGTRLYPATRLIPKPFLPVIDSTGMAVPIIHLLTEEVIEAGIEHVGLIIHASQRDMFESYFHGGYAPLFDQLPGKSVHNIMRRLHRFWTRVELITQRSPEGFGDAVYSAKSWIGGEPFLLLLGDHLYRSRTALSCSHQLLQEFPSKRVSLAGILPLPLSSAPNRGTVAGDPDPKNPGRYILRKILEKPDPETAARDMHSPGLPPDHVFCLFGCYAFSPTIMKILEEDVMQNRRFRNEIQLTEAMEMLRQLDGFDGFHIQGESLDIGNLQDYCTAFSRLKEPLDA